MDTWHCTHGMYLKRLGGIHGKSSNDVTNMSLSVLHGQWQGFLGCLQHRPCVSLPLVHVSKHIKVGTYHGWYLDVYVMTTVLTD
jgi:hypothetical protein